MPIYEYECRSCGRRQETMQSFSDPPLTTCSECGGELKKLVSAPAFQFKGSGWYVTDYARKGAAASSGSEGKAEAGDKADGAAPAEGGSKDESAGKKETATSEKATSGSTPQPK